MDCIKYLLEANLYLALFYAAYYLFMRRETYYQLNRAYLLGSSVLAFMIPLLQLGFLKPATVPVNFYTTLAVNEAGMANQTPADAAPVNYYLIIYLTVAALLAISLGIRIFQLIKLAKRGKHHATTEFKLIDIEEDERAFSFFNYLFIGKKLSASATVIQHELVHIRQLHSLDIIYLELLKIICWFNPFVYLLQHSLKEIHEFIADSHIAASQQNVDDYTDFLIGNAYGLSETALTNNFFNKKLLKTRIIMLHQKRSGSLARLKYLVALPLLAGMLCLSTLGFTKNYMVIDLVPRHDKAIPGIVNLSAPAAKPKAQSIAPLIKNVAAKNSGPKHIKALQPHHKKNTSNDKKPTETAGNVPAYTETGSESENDQPVVINVPIAKMADNRNLVSVAVVKQSKTNRDSVPDFVVVHNTKANTGKFADSAQNKKVLYVTVVRRTNESNVGGKAETTPLINNSNRIQVTTMPAKFLKK